MSCLTQEHADTAGELCRLLVPRDLAERAAYVVPFTAAAEFDTRFRFGNCSGWTMFGMDMLLRPLLTKQGRWRGRGFSCIWRDDKHDSEAECCAIALHELAHFLDWSFLSDELDEGEFQELVEWDVNVLKAEYARDD